MIHFSAGTALPDPEVNVMHFWMTLFLLNYVAPGFSIIRHQSSSVIALL